MLIKSLTIENLRGFAGKHEILFEDKHVAAFIGVNGSGKSTVLEAVAVCLLHLIELFTDVGGEHLFKFGSKDINRSAVKAIATIGFDNLTIHGRTFIRHTKFSNGSFKVGTMHSKLLTDDLSLAVRSNNKTIPILALYQESLPRPQKMNSSSKPDNGFDRSKVYIDAFMPSIDLEASLNFFLKQVNLQNSEIVRRKDLDYLDPRVSTYKNGLNSFLNAVEGPHHNIGEVTLHEDTGRQIFSYTKDGESLEFSQLSSGERLLIGLALDLIYRCVAANGHLPNPLDSEGIVLIDEIELHLHPRWQANIIKALTATFPNIQFIISTHAPLVINQLKEEQLFLLTKDGIVPGTKIQEPYGMDANTVISSIMGVPPRPQEIRDELDKLYRLLDAPSRGNIQKVKQEIDRLASIISPNDGELTQLRNILTLEESETDL